MSSIKTRFAILLALKAAGEGRRNIPLTEVERELKERGTPVSRATLEAYASNTLTGYSAKIVASLCGYLGCDVSDFFEMPSPDPADEPGQLLPSLAHSTS